MSLSEANPSPSSHPGQFVRFDLLDIGSCSRNPPCQGIETHLNEDILLAIMRYASETYAGPKVFLRPPHDLFALLHTCQYLYRHGGHLLLSRRLTYKLNIDGQNFVAFNAFLLNVPERIDQLRTLWLECRTISTNPLLETNLKLLGHILKHARHLEALSIGRLDHLFDIDSDLSSTVSSLPMVKSLRFHLLGSGTSPTLEMLASMAPGTPISRINLSFYIGATSTSDPVLALSTFVPTLRDVKLDNSSPLLIRMVFPQVQKLHLLDSKHSDLWILVHNFPNLRELFLKPRYERDNAASEHLRNKRACVTTWPSLDILVCAERAAYSFGISCKVRLWQIPDSLLLHSTTLSLWFHAILRDITPTHIVFCLFPSGTEDWMRGLDTLFSQSGGTLTHVDVTFCVEYIEGKLSAVCMVSMSCQATLRDFFP